MIVECRPLLPPVKRGREVWSELKTGVRRRYCLGKEGEEVPKVCIKYALNSPVASEGQESSCSNKDLLPSVGEGGNIRSCTTVLARRELNLSKVGIDDAQFSPCVSVG